MQIEIKRLDESVGGQVIEEYNLMNDHGMELKLSNLGCTLRNLLWPGRDGFKTDVLLGYDDTASWIHDSNWFGTTAGRCCNRIQNARFVLNDHQYQLAVNIPPHHLHGGSMGFNKKIWRAYPEQNENRVGVRMYLLSKDKEEGYPGNLSVEAYIELNNKNEIIIEFKAQTDETTICNITTHPYFNLKGYGDILDHELMIRADHITDIDEELIPTGVLMSVANSPFDFNKPQAIGDSLQLQHKSIDLAKGFDHNYVLNKEEELSLMASLSCKVVNRKINIHTNQKCIQFYSGNHLDMIGKKEHTYTSYSGVCLETQGYPNAANEDRFPSVVLKPGENYYSYTRFELIG